MLSSSSRQKPYYAIEVEKILNVQMLDSLNLGFIIFQRTFQQFSILNEIFFCIKWI